MLKNGPSPNSTPRMGWTWKQVLISKWAELELGVLSFSAQNQPIILECRSGPITTTINSNLVSDSLCTWTPFTQARPTRCRYAKAPKRPKHPPYSIQLPTLFMDNIVFLRKEKQKKRKTSIVAKRGEQRERERGDWAEQGSREWDVLHRGRSVLKTLRFMVSSILGFCSVCFCFRFDLSCLNE